jgi:uncharacterized protein YndB with AHSA1/START domain
MTKRTAAIRVSRRFRAPPERVFDAWLDPGVAGKWLFATASRPMAKVAIDARVRGAFRLVEGGKKAAEYTGTYTEMAPPRRLAFTLAAEHHPRAVTRVRVEIEPVESGCTLTVTNENVPPEHANVTETRWTGILYGLGAVLGVNDETMTTAASRRSEKKR